MTDQEDFIIIFHYNIESVEGTSEDLNYDM